MKLVMKFVIDDDGYPVRYGEDDLKKMTPAQRRTFNSLRNRYKAIQANLTAEQREHDAGAAEAALHESKPKLQVVTRKVV